MFYALVAVALNVMIGKDLPHVQIQEANRDFAKRFVAAMKAETKAGDPREGYTKVDILPPKKGFGSDPADFAIDQKSGQAWIRTVNPRLDKKVMNDLVMPLHKLLLGGRVEDAWAWVQGMPSKMMGMETDALTREAVFQEYVSAGAMCLDMMGRLEDCAALLGVDAWKPGEMSDGPLEIAYHGYSRKVSSSDWERVMAVFSPNIPLQDFFGGYQPTIEEDFGVLVELAAAQRANPWRPLQEVHFRRALALNPEQAMSAIGMAGWLCDSKRGQEALTLLQAAEPYARGKAKSLVQGRFRAAKQAISIQAATGG